MRWAGDEPKMPLPPIPSGHPSGCPISITTWRNLAELQSRWRRIGKNGVTTRSAEIRPQAGNDADAPPEPKAHGISSIGAIVAHVPWVPSAGLPYALFGAKSYRFKSRRQRSVIERIRPPPGFDNKSSITEDLDPPALLRRPRFESEEGAVRHEFEGATHSSFVSVGTRGISVLRAEPSHRSSRTQPMPATSTGSSR